jgi:hypothetical protein
MFNATDWKLTSLGGLSISAPTPISYLSLPGGWLPIEFTNTATGAVEKFNTFGGGASLGAPSPLSMLSRLIRGLSFSASMFPSSGVLYGMPLAKTPFDITQLHHRFLGIDDLGFTGSLHVSGSLGVMFFTYAPQGLVAAPALAVAACLFVSSGGTTGTLGPSVGLTNYYVV